MSDRRSSFPPSPLRPLPNADADRLRARCRVLEDSLAEEQRSTRELRKLVAWLVTLVWRKLP